MLVGALAVVASVVAVLMNVGTRPTPATAGTGAAISSHVVIVGLSGLRWADVSPSETPALWQLALAGSLGSLVDYAVLPRTCPADAWLTFNGGNRAQLPHGEKSPCPPLPAVTAEPRHGGHNVGPGPGHIAAMPSLVSYNHTLKYSPRWGLLSSDAGHGNCATAVGPGAALALAGPGGDVGSYLPSVSAVSRALLARCPLTVVDLGSLPAASGGHGGAAGERS